MTAEILQYLAMVESLRSERLGDAKLASKVALIKRYQQRRFERTYNDLLASSRYGTATKFFLDELYGPAEFAERDAQFAKIVPRLVRMMPPDVISAVRDLARLHAVSEMLDHEMALALKDDKLSSDDYRFAWLKVGKRDQRDLQLQLVLDLGGALDAFTRRPWITSALRVMRGPARAAGFASLQSFLEAGMSSFRSMRGAGEFLQIVRSRESLLIAALFVVGSGTGRRAPGAVAWDAALLDLPAGTD